MKSIKIKLVMLYLALVFIVMIVTGTYIYISIKKQETLKIERDLRRYARIIDEQIIQEYKEPELFCVELNDQRFLFGGRSDIQIAILDIDGKTLAPDKNINYKDSVILSAMIGRESFKAWIRGVDNKNEEGRIKLWMHYAVPTKVYNDVVYIIYLRMDASSLQERINSTTNIILIASIIAMILAIVLGVLFASTLTGPISILTKMAKEIAQGNLEQQIPVCSDDEIGQLTETFNNMGKSLYKTMHDMCIDKNRIEIILDNMTDGVLAFDNNGKIIHGNFASKDMLDIIDIEKLTLEDINDILKVNISNRDYIEKEKIVNIKDRYINATFTSYKNNIGNLEGLVIVLHDITKHRKLDNMRKEFVANVSHEIRTPLTTIKTYTETLLDLLEREIENIETAKMFLNVIDVETDRITFLAADLLELSRFDNNQLSFNMEYVELETVINNSIRQSAVLLEKKKQKIIFKNDIKNMYINCDPYRINQVLVNVLSNAIKYSDKYSDIIIETRMTNKYYIIFIKDEGMGIPKEDIDHIFERFYRVDKARSRSMGGTGLGLSIAKEIIDAHGGKIYAKSEIGKGTTMILKFIRV